MGDGSLIISSSQSIVGRRKLGLLMDASLRTQYSPIGASVSDAVHPRSSTATVSLLQHSSLFYLFYPSRNTSPSPHSTRIVLNNTARPSTRNRDRNASLPSPPPP